MSSPAVLFGYEVVLKNVALLVVSVVAGLAMSEIAVRAVYVSPDREMSGVIDPRVGAYQADPELGWVPRPLVRGTQVLRGGVQSQYSTNSLGLRCREIDMSKSAAKQRIVVVGDSFSWGWGVDDDEVFARRLETGRQDREVVNLGVIGYGPRQEIAYFHRKGEGFDPDVMVVAFCQNDIADAGTDYRTLVSAALHIKDKHPHMPTRGEPNTLVSAFKSAAGEHSATYRLVADVVDSHPALAQFAYQIGLKNELGGFDELDVNLKPFLKHYPAEFEREWASALAELLEMRDLASAHDMRFVLALIPALQSVDRRALEASLAVSRFAPDDFDLDRSYAAISNFARENSIEIVDPTEAFRSVSASGVSLYLNGDMHFNAEGHRLFAAAITDYLDGADFDRTVGI